MERSESKEMNEILGKKFPVLDDGFIYVVDYMGNDQSVVQAARVSYGEGTKQVHEDEGLIRYLLRNRHCYHPDMEVLTLDGWKKWSQCNNKETFIVPDPKTKHLSFEKCNVEVFDVNEEMECFQNNRMSYSVTSDHRMWFKSKYSRDFEVIRAKNLSKWGHFESIVNYKLENVDNISPSPLGELIGFILGDGSWNENYGVSFHLKKKRKIEYLKRILIDLNIVATEKESTSTKGAIKLYIKSQDLIDVKKYISFQRSGDKHLDTLEKMSYNFLKGIFLGLVNSDGYINSSKCNRIEYSSISSKLRNNFETLACLFGYDAHRKGEHNIIAYSLDSRTTLEARKQYFSNKLHVGKVYCATTSTGFLIVRGNSNEFGFVCGNTTPFEMCVLKLHVRVPMDTWRQWVRHRMSSINEYSTRYSEAIDSAQKTKYESWRLQSKSNKQGSESYLPFAEGIYLTGREEKLQKLAREVYEHRIFRGIAKEQARKDLPLSTYTEAYWKIDLHNLLHFLSLRMDSHAQKEIREYATIIGEQIVAKWCPLTWNAFKDYRMNSLNLSSREQKAIKLLISISYMDEIIDKDNYDDLQIILSKFKEFGWATEDNQLKKTSRELNEFKEKLKKLDMYYLFDRLEGLL